MNATFRLIDICLEPLMIITPCLISLLGPSKLAVQAERKAFYVARRQLLSATIVALALLLLIGWFLSINTHHYWISGVIPFIEGLFWIPLWFVFGMKALRLQFPEIQAVQTRPVRRASLTPRQPLTRKMHWINVSGWAFWMILLLLTVLGLMRHEWKQSWLAAFHLSALFWLIGSRYLSKTIVFEPEPLPENPSEDLQSAYRRFRQQRQQGLMVMGLAAAFISALPPTLLAWYPQTGLKTAILVGAGGGTLLGVFGGIIGTWASIQRLRLARLLLSYDTEQQ